MNYRAGIVFTAMALAGSAATQPVNEIFSLLPADSAADQQFGEEVDLYNGIVIVGAKGLPNIAVPVPGSAYLFDASTGMELVKLPLPLINGPDQYLLGVAIGPSRAMVATRNWANTAVYNPRIWLFDTTDPANPVFMQHIQPSDATVADEFGEAIDIEGSIAVVGAPFNRVAGVPTGAAYIFDTTTGTELGKIIASDGESVDQFGWSVDLDGSIVLIGARWEDDSAPNGGAAYLFDISDPANPIELAKLVPPMGDQNDYFGYEVAISGNTAAVGAIFDDDIGFDSGAVYVYDISTPSSPVLVKKLFAGDGDPTDDFGWSVAMEGATLLVGSRTDDDIFPGAGSAYLFDITDPANPIEVAKFVPSDTGANDTFGWSAELENDVAIIGASLADSPLLNAGAAYIFDATLPGPPCLPDVNHDGMVTAADFSAWIAAFNAGAPECDQNGDGNCTAADFSAWIANFNAGC
ncbi:MAG TPA: hypothetical protein ENJ00_08155 [Phycisphaerales bacterium]|nr:hypothetical protein [Phycisphaerales bacterium]